MSQLVKVVLDFAAFGTIINLPDGVNPQDAATVAQVIAAGGTGPVSSVFGRTGVVTAQANDYTFAQLASKPTTLAGYGITDAYPLVGNPSGFLTSFSESDPVFTASAAGGITAPDITNWNAAFSWGNHAGLYSLLAHTHTFASLTSKPTTLAGYGITDAYPLIGNPAGYLTSFSESDPVFGASAASGITAPDISNWNTAFGWGNHAGLYSFLGHTHAFSSLTGLPTTVAGYGITDAVTSVTGTSNRISITGTATSPIVDISATYAGQASINTLGTIGAGTWQGTAIADLYISSAATWSAKQAALISGTNIKTVNGNTLLGSGNVAVGDALVANPLSQFAATTSSQFLGVISDPTGSGAVVFGTAPTFTTSIIAPLVIGGTGTTSTLVLQSTSGVGTTNADIIFKVGNAGGTEAMRVLNSGFVGIGIAAPASKLDIQGTTASDQGALGAELLSASGWTSTNWTGSFAAGWQHTTLNTTALTNTLAAVVATRYQIVFTVTGRTAGSFSITFGGVTNNPVQLFTGSAAFGVKAITTGTLSITPTSDFDGTIVLSIKTNQTVSLALATFRTSDAVISSEIRTGASGLANLYIGVSAGRLNTTGINNVAVGYQSMIENSTGRDNMAVGYQALSANVSGSFNMAMGGQALLANVSGYFCCAVGYQALVANTTGYYNMAVGRSALPANTTGAQNTGVGALSLLNLLSGGNNTAIGYFTGGGITTGGNNTIIGANVSGLSSSLASNIIIANGGGLIKAQHDGTNWTLTGTVTASTFIGALTGTATTVTTNANLTGDITSVGNATTLTNAPVIAKVLTGYAAAAGTVTAADSILQSIQKLDGNIAAISGGSGPSKGYLIALFRGFASAI